MVGESVETLILSIEQVVSEEQIQTEFSPHSGSIGLSLSDLRVRFLARDDGATHDSATHYSATTASISIRPPLGRAVTWTVTRAG